MRRLDLLVDTEGEARPAAYVLTMKSHHTTIRGYDRLVETGWPVYVGRTPVLRRRLKAHVKTLSATRDLCPSEFEVLALYTDRLGTALSIEDRLIDLFRPLWNQPFASGVGSMPQGDSRKLQKRSAFAVLHGRRGACLGAPLRSRKEVIALSEEHLASSVKYVCGHRLAVPLF
jgi:hypothetical protein